MIASKKRGLATNPGDRFLQVVRGEKTSVQERPLYLGKYVLDPTGHPFVPYEFLGRNGYEKFRPLDLIRGRLVVREAYYLP